MPRIMMRWSIEKTIRFIKQTYDLENIRVLKYVRLQNMMALLLAVFYFVAVILDQIPETNGNGRTYPQKC